MDLQEINNYLNFRFNNPYLKLEKKEIIVPKKGLNSLPNLKLFGKNDMLENKRIFEKKNSFAQKSYFEELVYIKQFFNVSKHREESFDWLAAHEIVVE